MARKNPFRGIVDVMSDIDRMQHLGKTGRLQEQPDHERTHADAWIPIADIFASGNDLVIWMELAGLPREAIDITFADGVLTVFGERDESPDHADVTFWKRERYYGTFRRSIGLPETVSEDDISAASQDGLLTITVKGACASSTPEPRRIRIEEGSR